MAKYIRHFYKKIPYLFGLSAGITTYCFFNTNNPVVNAKRFDNEDESKLENTKDDIDKTIKKMPSVLGYIGSNIGENCLKCNVWTFLGDIKIGDLSHEQTLLCEKKVKMKTTHCSEKFTASSTITYNKKYSFVIMKIFKILNEAKETYGCPGLSFAISHHGNLVMKGGIGLADVENHVECTSESIMRIASISKSLTTLAVGKLFEEGLLDLNATIQQYVPSFPNKVFEGEKATITFKQVLSHTSGIRGYFDDVQKVPADDVNKQRKLAIAVQKYGPTCFGSDENYITKHYKSVEDGLELFCNDPLLFKPGTGYEYSTLAYSLVSRAIENISGKDYISYMKEMCNKIGMKDTCVDMNNPIIYNRARNYKRVNGCLENVPYVDNSYKWSGGGFLANVEDLVQLGNTMLVSAQSDDGFLKPSTVSMLWTADPVTKGCVNNKVKTISYALGWCELLDTDTKTRSIFHTGGAVGASSILFIRTNSDHNSKRFDEKLDGHPKGSVIALVVNMHNVGLQHTASRIQKCLDELV